MIYGERIRLRAIERDDIPRYVEWLNDPEVTAGLMLNLPMASWDETHWFENLGKRAPEERALAVEMKTPEGGWMHIGSVGFDRVEWINRMAEFGIFIGEKSLWDQGYGTEATLLMLKHGFETLNLNRIFLHVYENNPRAIHAYEKAGLVREGLLREARYRNGRYINVLLMSILRAEWDSIQKNR
jgi:RimJ/RimL family protein N-acetyltransferase